MYIVPVELSRTIDLETHIFDRTMDPLIRVRIELHFIFAMRAECSSVLSIEAIIRAIGLITVITLFGQALWSNSVCSIHMRDNTLGIGCRISKIDSYLFKLPWISTRMSIYLFVGSPLIAYTATAIQISLPALFWNECRTDVLILRLIRKWRCMSISMVLVQHSDTGGCGCETIVRKRHRTNTVSIEWLKLNRRCD